LVFGGVMSYIIQKHYKLVNADFLFRFKYRCYEIILASMWGIYLSGDYTVLVDINGQFE